jgi:hypothetical protein
VLGGHFGGWLLGGRLLGGYFGRLLDSFFLDRHFFLP